MFESYLTTPDRFVRVQQDAYPSRMQQFKLQFRNRQEPQEFVKLSPRTEWVPVMYHFTEQNDWFSSYVERINDQFSKKTIPEKNLIGFNGGETDRVSEAKAVAFSIVEESVTQGSLLFTMCYSLKMNFNA